MTHKLFALADLEAVPGDHSAEITLGGQHHRR